MKYGKTVVTVCEDEFDLGKTSARTVAERMRALLAKQDEIRVVFAAGESQMTFLDSLAKEQEIDWSGVVCFNVDDFWDPDLPEQFSCGFQTRRQLYSKVHPKEVHLVRFNSPDPDAEARRFEALLRSAGSLDILCQGIGTSGHLALNEPFQTDFHDSAWVRVVAIAEQSKRQLGQDPNFQALQAIPDKGITMTIPALLAARYIFTMVPLALKRDILTKLFQTTTPTASLPASILSTVASTLFVDRNSHPGG